MATSQTTPANQNPTVLLTIAETAERLGIHQKTVFKWLRERRLGAVRFGTRCTRIRQADLEAFIASGVTAPTK
jgi:excisionase family DNA binding protein